MKIGCILSVEKCRSIKRKENKMLYKAKHDKDEGVKGCKIIGNGDIYGYKLVNTYFVDNSGMGDRNEPAMIFSDFLDNVKGGYYYGIQEAGQFQVYIGEYEKITRQELKKQKVEQGIVSSKKVKNNTRLTIYTNGDKVLRLHSTDIIKWQGDKIILNTGGWDTITTRARFNEFLSPEVRIFRKKGITYIDYCGDISEFKDNTDIRNTVYTKK